jgi:hypothetical protein
MNDSDYSISKSSSLSIWILAIRIYRRVWLAVWFALVIGLLVLVQTEMMKASPPSGWIDYVPSCVLLLFFLLSVAALAGTGFWIFRICELLLEKYRNNAQLDFSVQRESVVLKRLLIAQFVMNLFLSFGSPRGMSAEQVEKLTRAGTQFPFLLSSVEKASRTLDYVEWITVPLDKTMPLIYLVAFVGFLRLRKTNQALERELEQIV